MKHRHGWLIGTLVVVALVVALILIAARGQRLLAVNGVIYVDADATGVPDGESWETAYTYLQDALEPAVTGKQIWVAEGIYKPTTGTDRTVSFQMKNEVAIYGGFVGTEESVEARDWVAHPTILSGDLDRDDGLDFANNDENSYHVFYHPDSAALDSSATLDGFTITGGNANGSSLNYGGGMYNDNSSPTLTNCTFEGNYGDGGGGLANYGSSPVLTTCIFLGNSGGAGGGMSNRNASSPTLDNCTFSGNMASNNGGGMWNDSSSPALTNCTFEGNSAGTTGGGMHNGGSSPTLRDCAFEGNSAGTTGGAVYNGGSPSPALVNCTFMDNSATDGGAVGNAGYASPTLTNCTFYANAASNSGGGMYSYYYSTPALTNSILWGDIPDEIWNENNSMPVVAYSDVQGSYEGEGNLDACPFFVDPGDGDFHLHPCSPCIDAGDNDAPDLPDYDFEGDDRIIDGDGNGTATVDMGVDEIAVAGTCFRIYLPVVLKGY